MDQVASVAEQMAQAVGHTYKAAEDKPLLEGRIVLFVCGHGYDYTEFGQMVEQRQIPASGRGHSHYDGVTAYGCIVPPGGDEYSFCALLAQQVGGLYIASLGPSPRWFYEGVGSAIGLRVNSPTRGCINGKRRSPAWWPKRPSPNYF